MATFAGNFSASSKAMFLGAVFPPLAFLGNFNPVIVGIPPIVTSVSPTPGIIGANTPISFDVTDESNSFKRIILVAHFPAAKIKEIILDGNGFGPMYSNGSNSQTVITNGFHYTVLRDGGWLPNDGPVITPFILDTTGEENV